MCCFSKRCKCMPEIACCNEYFPEWMMQAQWWILGLKTVVILIFSTLMTVFFSYWNERVFTTARITFGSAFILAIFMTYASFLVLTYGLYQQLAFEWWLKLVIIIVYVVFTFYLFIEQLIRGNLKQFKTDSILFDIWTIIHFLAGPFFAVLLPFIWMFLIVFGWEIMEALTYGFGESETIGNRAVDIGVAVIGWWLIILIFKQSRTDIPWISSKNSLGNNGRDITCKRLLNNWICCEKYKFVESESVELVTATETEIDANQKYNEDPENQPLKDM